MVRILLLKLQGKKSDQYNNRSFANYNHCYIAEFYFVCTQKIYFVMSIIKFIINILVVITFCSLWMFLHLPQECCSFS
jgi:L-asparagine transporter-like permease